MKTIIYKITILVSVAMLAFSCTQDFEDINDNPNRTTTVDPEALFMGSPVNTMMTFASTNNFWIFGNYSGQISMAGGVYPTYGSDGKEGNMWGDLYLKCINPLVTIETMKGNDPAFANRVAIARIWKAYIFSEMVALWGPVPYFEACKGKEFTPYNSEDEIYKDLLEQLKINADALNPNADKYSNKKDPVFNSDLNKWKKFAHSIRLRVASRLIDYEDETIRDLAIAVLREELDSQDIIQSNGDNFFMNFAQERNYWNPYYAYTQIDNPTAEGTYPVIHEQALMYLIGYEDPRLTVFCKKVQYKYATGKWQYRGRPSTTRVPEWDRQILYNPHNSAKQDYYSYITDEFAEKTAKWMIISYPEIACIRAEAAYRGLWDDKANAESYYYQAIDASGDRFGIDMSEYKEHWGIKWHKEGTAPYNFTADTLARKDPLVNNVTPVSIYRDYLGISSCVLSDIPAENPLTYNVQGKTVQYNYANDANYKRIVLQHWMSLFFQGIDSWTLLRRTQVLQFTPVWFPGRDTYTSYTQDWAYLPQRLPYPNDEITANSAASKEAIGWLENNSNSIQTKLKFAKPVVDFTSTNFPNLNLAAEFPYSVTFRQTY